MRVRKVDGAIPIRTLVQTYLMSHSCGQIMLPPDSRQYLTITEIANNLRVQYGGGGFVTARTIKKIIEELFTIEPTWLLSKDVLVKSENGKEYWTEAYLFFPPKSIQNLSSQSSQPNSPHVKYLR